jgi:hypothetical protein
MNCHALPRHYPVRSVSRRQDSIDYLRFVTIVAHFRSKGRQDG